MKTVLIIDGASNCAYDCFEATDQLFIAIFPEADQDIEFIEDFQSRNPKGKFDKDFTEMWARPIKKKDIRGIDGVLFYELLEKKQFYPNKKDSDLDGIGRLAR